MNGTYNTNINYRDMRYAFLLVDPVNGLTDQVEFNKYTRELLSGTQWDGVAMMEGIGCADGYFSHSGKRRLAA